jgi:hypothetical protein
MACGCSWPHNRRPGLFSRQFYCDGWIILHRNINSSWLLHSIKQDEEGIGNVDGFAECLVGEISECLFEGETFHQSQRLRFS